MEQPRVGTHYPRSTGEFQAWFRSDADCLDYLDWVRWPGGFTCPSCGHAGGWRLAAGSAGPLNRFSTRAAEPGRTATPAAWKGYSRLRSLGYTPERRGQRPARASGEDPAELLPNVNRVAALRKRCLLRTQHGPV